MARLFSILAMLALARVAEAQPLGSWQTLAPMPGARQEVGVAELGGKIYVIGGFDTSAQSVNTVERYNPATNEWESVAPLPAANPLNHVGAASVGGYLYAIGGLRQNFAAVATVFRYDPGMNQWTGAANLPEARGAMGVAVLGGKIYAAGGLPASVNKRFAVYDPALNEWDPLPELPTGRDHLAAAAVGGKFYAIAGRPVSITILYDAVEVYDPATSAWGSAAPIPTARGGIAGAAMEGKIYIFGGEGNAGNPNGVFSEVEEYDPATDEWRALLPMPVPRHGIGAAAVGRRIFIPGGGPVQAFSQTTHNDAFAPPATEAAILAYLLGIANDPAGLDANDDGAVDAADLEQQVIEDQ